MNLNRFPFSRPRSSSALRKRGRKTGPWWRRSVSISRRRGGRPLGTFEALENRVMLSTIQVTTLADEVNRADDATALSLREAILDANADPGPDTIVLPAGTIQFSQAQVGSDEDQGLTGDLDVLDDVTIVGAGSDQTTIDANGLDRVFHIVRDAQLASMKVKISGLTITGGAADRGGGIYNQGGTVALFDAPLKSNQAVVQGPAFLNDISDPTQSGLVTLTNSPLIDNTISGESDRTLGRDLAGLLRDQKENVRQGLNDFFDRMGGQLIDAFSEVEIPIIGDQLADGLDPIFTVFADLRSNTLDFLEEALSLAETDNGPSLQELYQGALYLVLGPGSSGLSTLPQSIQDVLAPLSGLIPDQGPELLQDGPDSGGDISPSDILLTLGEDSEGTHWLEFNFRLGQRLVLDLPQFDLGLSTFTQFISDEALNGDPEAVEQFNRFFETFGFRIEAEHGIRLDMRWDLRAGFGVSELTGSGGAGNGFYLNSGATLNALPDGLPIAELRASVDVFAAPASEEISFSQLFSDVVTTPDLHGNASMGLVQAEISDGTPPAIQITAPTGLPLPLLGVNLVDIDFQIVIDDGEPVRIKLDDPLPLGTATLTASLAALNGAVAAAFATSAEPLPPVSFTLDFSPIDRFFNPGAPTTPFLVLNARLPEINHLEIRGADEVNFLPLQYENRRVLGMGFANNSASTASPDGKRQTLLAQRAAPAEGISIEDPNFFLWVGGRRVVNEDGIEVTEGAKPLHISFQEKLNRNIDTLQKLRDKLQVIIDGQIVNFTDESTGQPFPAGTIKVEIAGDRFQLVSEANSNFTGSRAPLLSVTFRAVDQTKLSLLAAIDVQNKNFNASLLKDFPNDQRNFNRVRPADIAGAKKISDVFAPTLKADAQVRLHVDANTDHLTAFAEQQLGVTQGTIGLPEVSFDFKLDASLDFTKLFEKKEDKQNGGGSSGDGNSEGGDSGGGNSGGTGRKDLFSIDSLQFDNIALDVRQFLETVVVPVAQAAADVLAPVYEVIGHSANDPQAVLSAKLPVISDLVDQTVTLRSLLSSVGLDGSINGLLDVVSEAVNFGQTVASFIESDEFLELTDNGKFTFGCLELVMDPKNPLYFPKTRVPVPCELASIVADVRDTSIDSFMRSFESVQFTTPPGFSIDLFRPQTVFDMLLGEPFNIVSFGLPQIHAEDNRDFGFKFDDLDIEIKAKAEFNSNLRIVYDSLGLERIIDALAAGTDPDWRDLLAGFAIQNNDGPELGASVSFVGSNSIGPVRVAIKIEETVCVLDVCTTIQVDTGKSITVIDAEGSVDIAGSLELEMLDPNNDGKLRLDEISKLTNDFANPENLLCIFDIQGSGHANVSGRATVMDVTYSSGQMGLVGDSFSLKNLLGPHTGRCQNVKNTAKSGSPVLAEEVTIDGESVLRINTGAFAGARLFGDTDDSDATEGLDVRVTQSVNTFVTQSVNTFVTQSVNTFTVTVHDPEWPTLRSQTINGSFTKILAVGTNFDDTFDFSVQIPVEAAGMGGADVLHGGAVGDVLDGGPGNDSLYGGAGSDHLDGGGGDDLLDGGADADTLLGARGNDHLQSGPGDDVLDGGRGDDELVGGVGNDHLEGADGNDTLQAGDGEDILDGGRGDDVLDGGRGDDQINGDAGSDTLTGADGSDTLNGGDGNDLLDGGADGDTLLGGGGDDELFGGDGNDLLVGEAGRDTLRGEAGDDQLTGGSGDDLLDGGTDADRFFGDEGDDRLEVGIGDIWIDGNTGFDTLVIDDRSLGAAMSLTVAGTSYRAGRPGGSRLTTFYGGIEQREVLLGDGADQLMLQDDFVGTTVIKTGGGNDTVTVAGGGSTTLDSGGGSDAVTLLSTSGQTEVNAGTSGEDTVTVRAIGGPTTIRTGGAHFQVEVANSFNLLNSIAGALVVNGAGGGNTRLEVRETGAIVGRTITLDGSTIAGLGMVGSIEYHNLAEFELRLGAGDDVVNVELASTGTTETSIHSGAGRDTFQVNSTNQAETLLTSGSDRDIIQIAGTGQGEVTAVSGTGNDEFYVTGFASNLTLNGEDGLNDHLNLVLSAPPSVFALAPGVTTSGIETILVDAAATTAGAIWTLTGNRVRVNNRLAPSLFNVLVETAGAEQTELRLGSGSDTVHVLDISHQTTLRTGAGGDAIRVGGGQLSDIAAPLLVRGEAGSDTLTIDGTNNPQRSVGQAVSASGGRDALRGFGMTDGIEYEVELVSLSLGLGADRLTVLDVATALTVNAGFGDDEITVLRSRAPITIDGSGDDDLLAVDRSGEPNPLTGQLSGTQLTGLGLAAVNYSNIESLELDLGASDDRLTVTGIAAATTVRGNAGDDFMSLEPAAVGSIAGALTVNGDGGNDTVVAVWDGDPNALTQSPFATLGVSVETLRVDNSGRPAPADWRFTDGSLLVGAQDLSFVDTVGADAIIIDGQSAGSGGDSLTVTDNNSVPQRVIITGATNRLGQGENLISYDDPLQGTVRIEEGAIVLTPGQIVDRDDLARSISFLAPDVPHFSAVSPDGKHVYITGAVNNTLLAFRREEGSGKLIFVQSLQQGVGGVDGLKEATDVVVSPDGRYVFVVGLGGGLLTAPASSFTFPADLVLGVFARDAESGQLAFVGAPARTVPRLTDKAAFGDRRSVAVSPDGQEVYVTSAVHDSLVVFHRDASSGRFEFAGHVQSFESSQTFFEVTDVVVSPDGEHLYAVTGSASADRISAFRRKPADGSLIPEFIQKLEDGGVQGTRTIDGLAGALSVAISSDGKSIYVASNSDDAVAVFERNTDRNSSTFGELNFVQSFHDPLGDGSITFCQNVLTSFPFQVIRDCAQGLDGAMSVIVSPDGTSVYVGSFHDEALVTFSRDSATGELTHRSIFRNSSLDSIGGLSISPDGRNIYIVDRFTNLQVSLSRDTQTGDVALTQVLSKFQTINIEELSAAAVSPDGQHVAAISTRDSALVLFHRDPLSGVLSLRSIQVDNVEGVDGLARATAVAFSPDGRHLYVAGPGDDAIAVYSKQPSADQPKSGPPQFDYSSDQTLGVAGVQGLEHASAVSVSPDGRHVYVSSPSGIAVFNREAANKSSSTFGRLTFDHILALGPQGPRSGVAFTADGLSAYFTDRDTNRLLFYSRNVKTGALSFEQALTDGSGVVGLRQPIAVVLSPNEQQLYVAGAGEDTIALFARRSDGRLAFVESLRNGFHGLGGLSGISSLTVSPDGKFVFAVGADDNAAAVFVRDAKGRLAFVQRLRNNSGGVGGLSRPLSVIVSPPGVDANGHPLYHIYIASGGEGPGTSGGIARFQVDATLPPPASYQIGYTGMESLEVNSADGDDEIHLRDAAIPVTVDTAGGDDVVVAQNRVSPSLTLTLGLGNDILDLRNTGNGATVSVWADDADVNTTALGDDVINVWSTDPGATTVLYGEEGRDTFRVAGKMLASDLEIRGGAPTQAPGDTLLFDPSASDTVPPSLTTGDGTVKVVGTPFATVHYFSIEHPRIIAPPIADAGGPYVIHEGQSVKLSATDTVIPFGGPAVYRWDLDGDGVFGEATGPAPTVSWTDLAALGLGDDSLYTVGLLVTDSQGESGQAFTTLQVLNVAPTFTGSTIGGPLVEGSSITLTLGATDPAGASDPLTFEFDFDNDGSFEIQNGSGVAVHTFADDGLFIVPVRITDGDGGEFNGQVSLKVADVSATATIGGAASVAEGSPYTLNLSAFDPGADTIDKWIIDWGKGVIEQIAGSLTSVTHLYPDGPAQITIQAQAVTDDRVGRISFSNQLHVSVVDVPPALAISGGETVEAGAAYRLDLIAFDPGKDRITSWRIDWGDGQQVDVIDGDPASVTHSYKLPGMYTITAQAINEDGTFDAANTLSLTVMPRPPRLTLSGADKVDEGQPYRLTLEAHTSVPGSIVGWAVNWGDGTVETVNGGFVTPEHVFDGADLVTISAAAIDVDGVLHLAKQGLVVEVDNVPPTLTVHGPAFADEGPYTLELSAFDPGDDTIHEWTIDWGDGTFDTLPGDERTATHTFDGDGTYRIRATATDEDGSYDAPTELVVNKNGSTFADELRVRNVPPTITGFRVLTEEPREGSMVSVQAFAEDPAGLFDPPSFEFDFDNDGTFDAVSTTGIARHFFADDGQFPVTVRVSDGDGGSSTGTFAIVVGNAAPELTLRAAEQVDEGSEFVLELLVTDPGDDTISGYTVDWGDGAVETFTFTGPPVLTQRHVYRDGDALYQVTVSDLRDEDGEHGLTETQAEVTVRNVAPTLELTGETTVKEQATYSLTFGEIVDPGDDTVSAFTISWGDGIIEEFTGAPDPGAIFTHVYPEGPARHLLRVELSDEDGDWANAGALNLSVENVEPVVTVTMARDIDENDTLHLTGKFTDPGLHDAHVVLIDWGDGQHDRLVLESVVDSVLDGVVDGVQSTFSASHHYPDDNPSGTNSDEYVVSVTVLDDDPTFNLFALSSTQLLEVDPDAGAVLRSYDLAEFLPEADLPMAGTEMHQGLAFDGEFVYSVNGAGTGTIHVIDADNGQRIASFSGPADLGFVIDPAGKAVLTRTPILLDALAVDARAGVLYGLDLETNRIHLLDSATGARRGTLNLPTDLTVTGIDFDAAQSRLLAVTSAGEIIALSPSGTLTAIGTAFDSSLSLSGAGVLKGRLFVAAPEGVIHELDPDTGVVMATLTLPAGKVVSGMGGSPPLPTPDPASIFTATLSVHNVAPEITKLDSSAAVPGTTLPADPVTVSAGFIDIGTPDTHTATIDWGDGSPVETVVVVESDGSGTLTGTHIYGRAGLYTITVTVEDDDLGRTQIETMAFLTGAGINDGELQIVGTSGDDHVHVNEQGNGWIKVHAGFLPRPGMVILPSEGIERIVILLGEGNDHATISGGVRRPALLDGGPGNDHLQGGNGPNILVGGEGDDDLLGGRDRDLIIGGLGGDRLNGRAGEDILIAGRTRFDAHRAALWSLLSEWTSNRTYAERTANLSDKGTGPRLNGDYFLLNGATVFDDPDRDRLIGASGRDWYFFDPDNDTFTRQLDELFGNELESLLDG